MLKQNSLPLFSVTTTTYLPNPMAFETKLTQAKLLLRYNTIKLHWVYHLQCKDEEEEDKSGSLIKTVE